MHEMPKWYPYIDWDKSTIKIKVLKQDTPKEIQEDYKRYLKEKEKEKAKGYIDK